MRFKNKGESKFIKFLNGKAFYVVLCVCFVAIGVAAWTGVQGFRAMNELQHSDYGYIDNSSFITGNLSDNNLYPEINSNISSDSSKVESNASEPEQTVTPEPTEPTETVNTEATFFVSPVLGKMIKGYSDTQLQYSMTFGDMRLHKGIDIAAAVGTPVTAAGNGKVTAVEKDAMYGMTVEIDHGNGITVKYCGLNGVPCVEVGTIVDSSTQIGTVDVIPCESVEERHLHLEFFLNGKLVSPEKYINQ